MKSLLLLCALHSSLSALFPQTPDCAGIVDGTALEDECGDCHQAYIYNFITHAVTFVDNANEAEAGPNEIVVLPDDPLNPYWNAGCTEIAGCTSPTACNFNYLATTDDGTCGVEDDCGECQIPYCYNPVTHEVSYTSEADCGQLWIGPDMLSSPMNLYWNNSCTDCAGVVNGSALVDDCDDCHQAYIYNFITHAVTFIDIAEEAETGPNEIVVLPDDSSNPYWGASCAEVPVVPIQRLVTSITSPQRMMALAVSRTTALYVRSRIVTIQSHMRCPTPRKQIVTNFGLGSPCFQVT